jgi:hypothetical protein
MNDSEKKELIEKIFPYKEQRAMMFSLSSLIELLKYQKEHIHSVVWECYIQTVKKEFEKLINEEVLCQK